MDFMSVLMMWAPLLGYIMCAIAYFLAYRKAGESTAWMAFIPILSTLVMCKVARISRWWTIAYVVWIPAVVLVAALLIPASPYIHYGGIFAALIVVELAVIIMKLFGIYWLSRLYRVYGLPWGLSLFTFGLFLPGLRMLCLLVPAGIAFYMALSKNVIYR